jgi:hypothetical protein
VAFGDYDRDGWLDIHTTEWRQRDLVGVAAPGNNRLLRNLGASSPGTFEDVTESAGVSLAGVSSAGEWGFASSFSDLDDDGWPDLAVASDFQTSRLFWNNGDGTFLDGSTAAGIGTEQNGMGSTIGDYDGDGRLDWFVTAIFCNDPDCTLGANGNRLYRNNGDRTFRDDTDRAGVRNGRWGWGTSFLDYDNDGDLDLVMTNGVDYGEPEAAIFRTDPMRLWRNDGGEMVEVARATGLTDTGNGKGLAVFDYDRDGDEDVFVARHGQSGLLYRNDGGSESSYLRVRLVGTDSNRFGVGARVTVVVAPGAPPMVREVRGGNNFLGQNEMAAHFGLGSSTGRVSEVRIRWPRSGSVQTLKDVAVGRTLVVTEP